jgi:hypothetical protein
MTASLHAAPFGLTTMLNATQILAFAPWQHVRFESLADISQCNRHVRFTPAEDMIDGNVRQWSETFQKCLCHTEKMLWSGRIVP